VLISASSSSVIETLSTGALMFLGLARLGRTPAPPPFSSISSTPADFAEANSPWKLLSARLCRPRRFCLAERPKLFRCRSGAPGIFLGENIVAAAVRQVALLGALLKKKAVAVALGLGVGSTRHHFPPFLNLTPGWPAA
jgi:hypothetical protein